MNVKKHATRHARKMHRAGAGIGIGDGKGSISDGELTSLAGTQQASRLRHYQQQQQQQLQLGQRVVRLRDAGFNCPGQRRVMQAIRESPEISNNPADSRYVPVDYIQPSVCSCNSIGFDKKRLSND